MTTKLTYSLLICLFAMAALSLHAQRPVLSKMDFVRAEIQRIDKLDGREDGKVAMRDSMDNVMAHMAYFVWPDSIDNYIRSSSYTEKEQKAYRDYLFRSLRRIDKTNYRKVWHFEELFHQLYREVTALHDPSLMQVLKKNPVLSVQTCGIFRNEPIADSFLCYASRLEPDEIFKNIDDFSGTPYAQHLVEYTAIYAPEVAKKYFLIDDPVLVMLRHSKDTAVNIIMKITDDYGKKSNAYVLLDDIVAGKMTIKEADLIGSNPNTFFAALNEIRKKRHPLAAYSLEKEIQIQALKIVRLVNDLHNEKKDVRFKSIVDFTPDKLYTLVVYSEEDIFTSTFDGIFRLFMHSLAKRPDHNGFRLILSMGDNHFRTFIKQFAAYGKLDTFLTTMSPEQRNILMVKFAAQLDNEDNDISQAVEVADAYTSITAPAIKVMLQQTISMEMQRVSKEHNKKGTVIYSLLFNLFLSNPLYNQDWYRNVAKVYGLPPLAIMPNERLFENNKKCIWQMYFYDDEDGGYSFNDLMRVFGDSLWTIEDHDSIYVTIKSNGGKPVEIYANRPKAEYEGQALLEGRFDSLGITPDVLIHRGHSYYAYKTIDKTKPGTKIFVLGSCGGYHNLNTIIDKAPDVNIISSKQIGIFRINNPILKALGDNIRSGEDINWAVLWKKIDDSLKGEIPEIYGKFPDYIPPHKNMGAIFIRAYNKMMDMS